MNKVRIIKGCKNSNSKLGHPYNNLQLNSEQLAKKNLFQISQTNFYSQQHTTEPDLKLETNDQAKSNNSVPFKRSVVHNKHHAGRETVLDFSPTDKLQLLKQFKKLADGIESLSKHRKTSVGTQRSYHLGDRWIGITMRNPIAVSNYLVSGCRKSNYLHSAPPVSQYVIRQQRNVSRLKKSKSKLETQKQNTGMKLQMSFTQTRRGKATIQQSEMDVYSTRNQQKINQIQYRNTRRLQKQLL